MKGGVKNQPDPEQDTANIDPEEMSTNQEGIVVPWGCGEFIVSLRWVSPVYNQFTKEAPIERPGKK